jgi:hypothetical protein
LFNVIQTLRLDFIIRVSSPDLSLVLLEVQLVLMITCNEEHDVLVVFAQRKASLNVVLSGLDVRCMLTLLLLGV